MKQNRKIKGEIDKSIIIVWDFPGGPGVKNPPPNAGDVGSIPGGGAKIPNAAGQLNQCTATTEHTGHN